MNVTNTNGISHASENSKPLNIIIAGAGIGGLAAATFLRQQGHIVTLLEQSRFANELGAAVHLAPNANGLLRRMGLWAEKIGAIKTQGMTQFTPDGKVMFSVDLSKGETTWLHPWLLAHRVQLHSELRRMATSEQGKGTAATLRTSSRVEHVATDGKVTLASGEELRADVVIGADGVHSKTRYQLPGCQNIHPFGSGKSAFRFLIPRQHALSNPSTAKFAEKEGHLSMFMGRDRRVVIYPTSNNELLNFVCIHPSSESQVANGSGDDWQQQGNLQKMLEVFRGFEPALVELLGMADEGTLKVWELLDMESLPTWTEGVLACIGDAAHPFTPHQGQGAGQAIEDAASLAVVLPLGTPVQEIPSRLKLYEKCRFERASRIQEYSRISGRDLGDGPTLNATEYTGYNFGHDEWDFSTQRLREWEWQQKENGWYWRMPTAFGPMPGPRQDFWGRRRAGENARFRTASVKFKTSRTVLQNLLPPSVVAKNGRYKFASPATVAYATFSITTLQNLEWLGGRGYSHFGLYIHGVQCTTTRNNNDDDDQAKQREEKTVTGTYLPILFENLADPILSGREELGMPKVFCDMDFDVQVPPLSPQSQQQQQQENSPDKDESNFNFNASWMTTNFCTINLSGLAPEPTAPSSSPSQQQQQQPPDQGLLFHKTIPATPHHHHHHPTSLSASDSNYPVFLPHEEEAKSVNRKIDKVLVAKDASVSFDASKGWGALPTLQHVVERLAEVPVCEVVEARVVEGRGVGDVRGVGRL